MDINTQLQMNTNSIKQALNTTMLQKALKQDAESVATLLHDMNQTTAQIQNINKHLGKNLDVRV